MSQLSDKFGQKSDVLRQPSYAASQPPPAYTPINAGQPTPSAFTPINLSNATSYHGLENYANSSGPSPWLQMQNQQIGLQTNQMRDQGAQQATQGLSTAQDNLASQGGLSGGDAARLQMAGMRNRMANNTAASTFGANAMSNAGIQDYQNKLNAQQGLAGQELTLQTNAAGALNNYNMFNYGEKNKAYMGDQLSNAVAAGGGGGGLTGPDGQIAKAGQTNPWLNMIPGYGVVNYATGGTKDPAELIPGYSVLKYATGGYGGYV